MNNYALSRTPATLSVAAGMLMVGYTTLALAQIEASERMLDRLSGASTIRSNDFIDSRLSPTLEANVHEVSKAEAAVLLEEASDAFAASLSSGVESLGSDFSVVIEENFWDLVLR